MNWLLTYPEDAGSVPVYEAWTRACGATPHTLPASCLDAAEARGFDALLLTGGGDVDPARYGAARHPRTGGVRAERDVQELRLFQLFRDAGRPVFGICRGLQFLNVALGGALIQHVPDLLDPAAEAHGRPDTYETHHPLTVDRTTDLGTALQDAATSNSSHHQAADPARIGRGLRVVARSGAGLIEALEGPGLSAVQWHPERLSLAHPASARLREHWRALARLSPARNRMS